MVNEKKSYLINLNISILYNIKYSRKPLVLSGKYISLAYSFIPE